MNVALGSNLLSTAPSTWQARLSLAFAKRQRGVRLVKSEHEGPLYVQKAFYPEGPDCAHVYLLHPPGGLVTGDTLNIDVTAQVNTHVLLTTPGAGRVYKAREKGGIQTQNLHITVEENAVLEWFPLETILFPASHARMKTRVDLSAEASFIAWDITCFGLPANDVKFDSGSVKQNFQIWREGKILLNESLVIDDDDSDVLKGCAGLRDLPVNGLMLAGPFKSDEIGLVSSLRELELKTDVNDFFAVSLNGEFLTIRYLGTCTEKARLLFAQAWALIRPALVNKESTEPRIWAT